MKLMLNGKEVSGMGHYVMAGDIKDATAEDSNVLSGKAFYNNNGKREGTMPNRGGMSAELAAGGSTTIPEGYHNGEGVVRAQDLASQTAGTAAAGDILTGKTAWVNGAMLTGSLVKGKNVKIGTTTATSGGVSITGIGFKPNGFMLCAQDTYNNAVGQKILCVFDDSGKSNSSKDIYYVNYNNRYSTIDVDIRYYDNSIEILKSGVWPKIKWAYVVWGE